MVDLNKAIIIFPSPLARRHPRAFSCRYRVFGRLVYNIKKLDRRKCYLLLAHHYIKILSKNLIYIRLHRGRPNLREVTPREVRKILLEAVYNEMIIEPVKRGVKEIASSLLRNFPGLNYYYTITDEKVYTPSAIPENLVSNMFYVQLPIAIIFAEEMGE